LSDSLNCSGADIQSLADVLIYPPSVRVIDIGFKQDTGMIDFSSSSFTFFG
jgi:hypothetical protein